MFTYLYIYIYIEFNQSNLNIYNNSIFSENINSLLINSVNKIHPLLLYSSILFFFINKGSSFNLMNFIFLQKYSFMAKLVFNKISSFIIIIILSLFLGSWWALQEGSWGGWWNWDPSEVFGLLILTKILFMYHLNFNIKSHIINSKYVSLSIFSILLFYLFMQINFNFISHNFGFKVLQFINKDLLLILWLTILFLFKMALYNNILFYNSYIRFLSRNSISLIKHLILFLLIFLINVSLLILINNFLWNCIQYNLINFQINFHIILIVFYYLLIYTFTYVNLYLITYASIFLLDFISFIILLFTNIKLFETHKLIIHLLMFFIFWVIIWKVNFSINLWSSINYLHYKLLNYNVVYNLNNINILNNFINLTTSPEAKSFKLIFNNNTLIQKFAPLGEFNLFSINIESNVETILIFTLLLISIIFKYLNKILIVF